MLPTDVPNEHVCRLQLRKLFIVLELRAPVDPLSDASRNNLFHAAKHHVDVVADTVLLVKNDLYFALCFGT
jgi:hypothetical protein